MRTVNNKNNDNTTSPSYAECNVIICTRIASFIVCYVWQVAVWNSCACEFVPMGLVSRLCLYFSRQKESWLVGWLAQRASNIHSVHGNGVGAGVGVSDEARVGWRDGVT